MLSSVYTTSGQYADSILNGNCWSTLNTNLTVGTALTVSITQLGSVLSAVVSGGFVPYNYLWNTFATSPDITISSGGLYSLSVTDNLSCPVVTASYNVNLNSISDFGISDLKIYPNPTRDVFNVTFT